MSDHIWMVTRVADLAVPYAPAQKVRCSECGETCWLGDALRWDVPDGIPMCTRCCEEKIEPEDTVVVTPSVRREAAEYARAMRRRRN